MPGTWRRRFRFPILLVGTFLILAVAEGTTAARQDDLTWAVSAGVSSAVLAVLAYAGLTRWVEGRPVPEARSVGWLIPGIVLGAAFFGTLMLAIRLLGGWGGQTDGSLEGLAVTAGIMACVAACEELVFRGVLVRILAERFGGWGSLAVSSVLFGAMHLVNEHATVQGALAIGLTGGLLLGAAYLATRSLWLPIGIHFGWNLLQAGVFGVRSSGTEQENSLFHTTLDGSQWLTGGEFGPEASVVVLAVLSLPTLALLTYAARTGRMRRADKLTEPAEVAEVAV
ncbi:hypothetical protein Kisp01_25430 [Kineosporia sp. NBRC 101677]|uniref:CPBP family intramembrane glutamic endopeptidase n=1 Tax=Kineosporia sp. NBRC 101677 TaxID=3032197 RepID=UPI0024A26687|nr:type II CAAX endopeptidase family protein [Kineosporia sp. NBRC 101677]GLY15528.1 hypothetical protein Kisp01_25430 [Kineosporia sp. NBRC 101677]